MWQGGVPRGSAGEARLRDGGAGRPAPPCQRCRRRSRSRPSRRATWSRAGCGSGGGDGGGGRAGAAQRNRRRRRRYVALSYPSLPCSRETCAVAASHCSLWVVSQLMRLCCCRAQLPEGTRTATAVTPPTLRTSMPCWKPRRAPEWISLYSSRARMLSWSFQRAGLLPHLLLVCGHRAPQDVQLRLSWAVI